MNLLKKEQKILEVLSDFYIFITLIIYPLLVDKTGFFKILECKWYSYLLIGGCYLISSIGVILYFLFFKKCNIFKEKKLSIIHYLILLFLFVNILSTFISPYYKTHNLFIGVGRGEGLIMISLYTLSFFFVSLFAKFKKQYLLYFSIASILLNTIAILQYIGFNPFYMYKNGIGTHNVSFMTTIGNVDFISALYCILISVSFGSFIFLDEDKKYKIIHLLSFFMAIFILSIIDVSSSLVALAGTLVIIIPFIICSNKRLSRFLITIATFLLSFCVNIIINPQYHYSNHTLKLYFQFNTTVVIYIIIIAIIVYLANIIKKISFDFSKNKKIIITLYLFIIGCGIIGIVCLYFFNFSSGILYEAHELLHGNFDDSFGTYRIFLWKRTLTLVKEFPLLGSGPDSFALRFMSKFSNDVASIGPLTINDTAANVYLTMLINTGILGLFSYLSFLFCQIKLGLKKINPYSSILLIAIICYLIQDFFNLSVVIISPIFWLLLAIHYRSICS